MRTYSTGFLCHCTLPSCVVLHYGAQAHVSVTWCYQGVCVCACACACVRVQMLLWTVSSDWFQWWRDDNVRNARYARHVSSHRKSNTFRCFYALQVALVSWLAHLTAARESSHVIEPALQTVFVCFTKTTAIHSTPLLQCHVDSAFCPLWDGKWVSALWLSNNSKAMGDVYKLLVSLLVAVLCLFVNWFILHCMCSRWLIATIIL